MDFLRAIRLWVQLLHLDNLKGKEWEQQNLSLTPVKAPGLIQVKVGWHPTCGQVGKMDLKDDQSVRVPSKLLGGEKVFGSTWKRGPIADWADVVVFNFEVTFLYASVDRFVQILISIFPEQIDIPVILTD